jgi:rhodanese-related sulfurtransferase
MVPTEIDRVGVQQFMERGAQIVDVLPANEYAEQHLPGAINIPLKRLHADTAAELRRDQPVIVYCHDFQ